MAENLEITILKANVHPVGGREVFWLISKNQLEHIVGDVVIRPIPFAQKYLAGIATWQGLMLPVVSLEKYFKFKTVLRRPPTRWVLVKTAGSGGKTTVARLLLSVLHDIKIKPLDTDCIPAKISQKELDIRGLSGVYEWGKDKLLLVPDLARIALGGV